MSSPKGSRSATPDRGSRPTSRQTSSREAFKPAGKPNYTDSFLLWDEDEMARRPESGPGRESAVIRRGTPFGHDETGEGAFVEGKAGENGESPAPFEITAWDET